MDLISKIALTVMGIIPGSILVLWLINYFMNAEDINRRYRGKNKGYMERQASNIVIGLFGIIILIVMVWSK